MRIDLAEGSNRKRGRKRGSKQRKGTTSYANDVAIFVPRKGSRPGSKNARGQSASRRRSGEQPRPQGSAASGDGSVLERPRRKGFLTRTLLVLTLAAMVAGIVYVSSSRKFYVYGAEITGCQHLSADEIYQTAGLNTQHILWISPQRIEERLAGVPGVKSASVRRKMPARVLIDIEEREPSIRWYAAQQGKEYWLDEEGVVLPYQGAAEAIIVTDTGERQLEIGEQIELEGVVPAVRQIIRFVPGVRSFSYDPEKGLSFSQVAAGGQWPVLVGDGQQLKQKVQAILALSDFFEENGIQPMSVDVTRPRTAVYRQRP